jgi:hypothetical protein
MGCLESVPPGASGWPSSGRRRRAWRRPLVLGRCPAGPGRAAAQGREGEQEEDRAPGEAAVAYRCAAGRRGPAAASVYSSKLAHRFCLFCVSAYV